jgi:hypothetical protein
VSLVQKDASMLDAFGKGASEDIRWVRGEGGRGGGGCAMGCSWMLWFRRSPGSCAGVPGVGAPARACGAREGRRKAPAAPPPACSAAKHLLYQAMTWDPEKAGGQPLVLQPLQRATPPQSPKIISRWAAPVRRLAGAAVLVDCL